MRAPGTTPGSWSDRQRGGTLSRRGGQLLIRTEVALAVITLAGAGLMLRSFSRLISVELGFDPTKILAIEARPVEPRAAVYASYYPTLVSAIRRLPGVEAVGAADSAPLGLGNLTYFLLVGKPGSQPTDTITRTVVPGYFEAFGITVVAGTRLTDSDMVGQSDAIMINERAARRWFANANAVGQVPRDQQSPSTNCRRHQRYPHWRPRGSRRAGGVSAVSPESDVEHAATSNDGHCPDAECFP